MAKFPARILTNPLKSLALVLKPTGQYKLRCQRMTSSVAEDYQHGHSQSFGEMLCSAAGVFLGKHPLWSLSAVIMALDGDDSTYECQ